MSFKEEIKKMTKHEQWVFFEKAKHLIPISQIQIARAANVTPRLVSALYRGVNQSNVLLEIIEANIQDGWQEFVKPELINK
jgi:ABC-type Zn uptake system ZnuABC Zn-binding protein ZnuA